MKYFCLRLVLVVLLGTTLLSLLSQKALAKDSYGLTWTEAATPSAVAVDLSDNIYYAGFLASDSATQLNPFYVLNPLTQPSDIKTATTGALFLTKINSDLSYGRSYIIEADQPRIVNDNPTSIVLTRIATDSAKNVFLLGSFNGNVNFNPTGGEDFHSSNGESWSFLTEIKADGSYAQTYLWQDPNITLKDIVIDKNDNIFLAGSATDTSGGDISVNLNPLGGSDPQILNADDTLAFYTKLVTGAPYTYGFSKTFKNTALRALEVDHLALASSGDVFLYGVFAGTMNFNSGGSDFKNSNGSDDIYLSKYDASGNYVLTYTMGGTGLESAKTLGIDSSDNVYYSGGFNNTVNFNPVDPIASPDSQTADPLLPDQVFLTKLNSDGSYGYTLVWNSNTLAINKIAFDNNNLIYLVGTSVGTTNYDPIATSDSKLSFGGSDAFLTVLNPDKTYNYTYTWGGAEDDKAMDAAFDSSWNLYVAGSTKSLSVNFDPTGQGSTLTTFDGGENGYVTQFSSTQLSNPTPTPSPSPVPQDNSSSNAPSSSSGPQSFTCTSPSPVAPKIFQIWATQTTATIYFVPSSDTQDSYTVSYGLYSDAGMYNSTFGYSDKSGAIPYKVNALSSGTTYYFKVRANNGCMPGSWSNTLSLKTARSVSGSNTTYATNATTTGKNAVLGASCSQYTVLPGDSFWKIAQTVLGAGNKYLQIWDLNKGKFPSLNSSSVIRSGWTLSVGC